MIRNRLYYLVKPYLPRQLRMSVRRFFAKAKRERYRGLWPIDPRAGRKPAEWPGWPDGKRFAFVLTHDVESPMGLERVRPMAELEMSVGFRSCFNFIPEGPYQVPEDLRTWLVKNGFEVGVHDLHHDGRLYSGREAFREKARQINGYLKAWGAVGFRSGFMLRNLHWLQDLEVSYESSTFDTDPFEPMPEGVQTIFPFWLSNGKGGGFVELPYTLPQDSTVYNLFGERDFTLWRRKLEWIVRNGGMALLNIHPDYVALDKQRRLSASEFPGEIYLNFLKYVAQEHGPHMWHALPKEVAEFAKEHRQRLPAPATLQLDAKTRPPQEPRSKIWIDLDNTPHIPFFRPIIRELEARGYELMVTARDAFQVCDLADRFEVPYRKFGHHHGKKMLAKAWGVVARSFELAPTVLRERPTLSLNHGSRAQTLVSNILGIPTVMIMDYEHTGKQGMLRSPRILDSRYCIIPDCVPAAAFSGRGASVFQYRGIKEDVYAPEFCPDPALLLELGLSNSDIVVTVRPPANEAHYRNPESDVLFVAVMDYLLKHPDARVVLLPRKKSQEQAMRASYPVWFSSGRVVIPKRAVDGMNLVWFSDLVVSGGGTMNREAAALGVRVYSVFRGAMGAVDRSLVEQGRLVMLENISDVAERVSVRKRDKTGGADSRPRPAMGDILGHLEAIMLAEAAKRRTKLGGAELGRAT